MLKTVNQENINVKNKTPLQQLIFMRATPFNALINKVFSSMIFLTNLFKKLLINFHFNTMHIKMSCRQKYEISVDYCAPILVSMKG